jgi:hypothetical protein
MSYQPGTKANVPPTHLKERGGCELVGKRQERQWDQEERVLEPLDGQHNDHEHLNKHSKLSGAAEVKKKIALR